MEEIINNIEKQNKIHNLKSFLKSFNNIHVIIFFIFLILGLAFGGFFGSGVNYSFFNQTDIIFNNDFQNKSSEYWYVLFLQSLCSQFIFSLSAFLMGFSLWGFSCLFLISFLKGFGIGVISGFLIANYNLYGLLYYSVIILPGAFISIIALIIQQKNSYNLSKKLFNITIGKSEINKLILNSFFKIYFKGWGVSVIIMLLASSIDTFLYSVLTTFFNKI